MEFRLLGNRTGLQVSEMALGTGRLGMAADGSADREAAASTLAAYAEAGGNFIDTSSAYLGGLAESLVGEFLSGRDREAFVISSKYGRTPLADPPRAAAGIHRKALAAEVEASLKRLRTDRIDLYFPHFDDGVTPIEEMLRGLDDLARAGKILHIGLSNFPAWRAASAVVTADLKGCSPVSVLQLQYNLLERTIERDHIPLVETHGLALMAWSPLAGGRLVRKNATEATQVIIAALETYAAELGVTANAVALAWLKHKNAIPVIGARNASQLKENLEAAQTILDAAVMGEFDRLTAIDAVYPWDLLQIQQRKLGLRVR